MTRNFTVIDEEFICENCGKQVPKLRIFLPQPLPILLAFKTRRYKSTEIEKNHAMGI